MKESKLYSTFYLFCINTLYSLLLDSISRLESMNQLISDDESGSDIYSDISDTDEDLDGKTLLFSLYKNTYAFCSQYTYFNSTRKQD